MKLKVSRFLSGIMAGLLLFVLCVPAFASDGSFGGDRDVAGGGRYGITDFFGFAGGRDYVGGGRFSSKEDYDDYVGTLPASSYRSDGKLSWRLNITSYKNYGTSSVTSFTGGSYFVIQYLMSSGHYIEIFFDEFIAPINGYYDIGAYYSATGSDRFKMVKTASGSFYWLFDNRAGISYFSDNTHYHTIPQKEYYEFGNKVSAVSGTVLTGASFFSIDCDSGSFQTFSGYIDVICEPLVPPSGDVYDITTRPTTITGSNYGIVGDDGQLTVVTVNDSIINETNNTYYNPATGNSETINNWTYDYSDRSYNITLESGDTVTVTYGDQYITVIEGGDTYIIYYVIDGGCTDPGNGDDDPVNSDSPSNSDKPSSGGSDEHSWVEVDRTEPICTLPGRINYVCDHCGQTRVDVLPALGHVWSQKQFVPTTYDDEGNLIRQGYTIYECTVCGEQYKDETGTGPPGSSGGSSSSGDSIWSKLGELLGTLLGGIIGLIEAVIGKILDALIALGQMLMDKLAAVVEVVLSIFEEVPKLFGGFLDFLAAIFPFLPPEIMLLLTFGIAAVVFIGIIKAIRR